MNTSPTAQTPAAAELPPEQMPVVYETSTGIDTDKMPAHWIPAWTQPTPEGWHIHVRDGGGFHDKTFFKVYRPDYGILATFASCERMDPDNPYLVDLVAWLASAARLLAEAAQRLAAKIPPAVVWKQVADAFRYAGRGSYMDWAKEIGDQRNPRVTAHL